MMLDSIFLFVSLKQSNTSVSLKTAVVKPEHTYIESIHKYALPKYRTLMYVQEKTFALPEGQSTLVFKRRKQYAQSYIL